MGSSIMLVQGVYKPTALSNSMDGYLHIEPREGFCRMKIDPETSVMELRQCEIGKDRAI